MTKNLNIQQVIVVEGKTDTQKLQRIFGPHIQTIETNGLSLTPEILALIKKVNAQQGVIIFTDPDGPGKKIRQTINDFLDGEVQNAFITKQDVVQGSTKIGIAEASDEAIHHALDMLISFNNQTNSLTWGEYLNHNFYLKRNRMKLANHFGFDEQINSKTLYKWLNWMGEDSESITKILKAKKVVKNG